MTDFLQSLPGATIVAALCVISAVLLILVFTGKLKHIGKDGLDFTYSSSEKKKKKEHSSVDFAQQTIDWDLLFSIIKQSYETYMYKKDEIISRYNEYNAVAKSKLISNVINNLLIEYPKILDGKSSSVDEDRDILELYLDRDISDVFGSKLQELYNYPNINNFTTIELNNLVETAFNEIIYELKVRLTKYQLINDKKTLDSLYDKISRNLSDFLGEALRNYMSYSKKKQEEVNKLMCEHNENLTNKIVSLLDKQHSQQVIDSSAATEKEAPDAESK